MRDDPFRPALRVSVRIERWIDSENRYEPWQSWSGEVGENFERLWRFLLLQIRPSLKDRGEDYSGRQYGDARAALAEIKSEERT